ncbi:MAG: NAD-dependent epimerase/dehydratase family protein, partial [Vicinamibacterales bacterium]
VLVLGGTRFIGRHIVETLLASGHGVSVFTRGTSRDELPGSVERLHGDRSQGTAGLAAALTGRSWDACIDVSGYTPTQVRASAELLLTQVSRYLFISTVSVYSGLDRGPVVETDALLPEAAEDVVEVTGETYGPLKVTCERIIRTAYGERCTILRPQIVAGPYDPTGRHTYWVQRATKDDEMLAPGDGQDHVQVVDARDLARFAASVVERNVHGTFNMAGPRMTWATFMETLGASSAVCVGADILRAANVTSAELPLFIEDGAAYSGIMQVAADRAAAAGFTVTDAATTVADTRAWLRNAPVTPALSLERERELIAAARTRN